MAKTLSGRLFGGIDRKVRKRRTKKKALRRKVALGIGAVLAAGAVVKKRQNKDAKMLADARKRREAYFKSRKR